MASVDSWNNSHERIPMDKGRSRYAEEKEVLFKPKGVICDLGGGTGADAMFFLNRGHKVILVDISNLALSRAIDKAKSQNLESMLEIHQTDLDSGKIPLPNESCDGIFARLSLHYFDQERTVQIFREIERILKTGGIAFATLKSPKDSDDMRVTIGEGIEQEPGVYVSMDGQIKSRFSIDQLKNMLVESDVKKFEVNEYLETMDAKNDITKSGLSQMIFNEVIIRK